MSNGFVFVLDKAILGTGGSIAKPAKYAGYSGLVAAGAAALLLFGYAPPTLFIMGWSLVAGVLWVAALWLFFVGLKFGEPSRIVPIIGSAVPLFTLLIAATFLGERLAGGEILAVLFLIAGGALLSIRLKGVSGVPIKALAGAVFGGAAFAGHFALTKFLYDNFDPFLAAFSYVRLGVGIVAALLLLWLWVTSPKKKKRTARASKAKKKRTALVATAFVSSKVIGTGALVLQNYAISLGSVTIVNALQGTQYVFVLLLAGVVSTRWPKLFREELGRVALMQKIAGILLVSVGLILILDL